jgi:predicted DNA-binding transcriptional regulator AlpA
MIDRIEAALDWRDLLAEEAERADVSLAELLGSLLEQRRAALPLAAERPDAQAISRPQRCTPIDARSGMWTARDVADHLGLSLSWVYHRAAEGRIPCVRIQGALRFDPEAIRAFARGEGKGRGRVVALNARG